MHSNAAFNVTKRARLPHKIVARARNYDLNCTRTTLTAKHKTWDLCISCRQNSGCEKKLFLGLKMWHKIAKVGLFSDFSRGVKTTLIFSQRCSSNKELFIAAMCSASILSQIHFSQKQYRIPCRPKVYEAKLNVSYTSVTCFGGQCLAMHTDFFQ